MVRLLFLGLVVVSCSSAMEFTPYRPSEQYKCGAFLQNRIDDQTLDYYYSFIDSFLSLLSNPFPHEELLNRQALMGDVNEVRQSIETNYADVGDVIYGLRVKFVKIVYYVRSTCGQGGLLVRATDFKIHLRWSITYVSYTYAYFRCCVCCCASSSRKENTDSRYDGCKRNLLNAIMALLVLLDVFAAATLLITSQYANYGLEELPNRLNYCIDDLNLYKRDTDARIRKLLIDDYQMLNRARDIHEYVKDVRQSIRGIMDDHTALEVEYRRLEQTLGEELRLCLQNEVESMKTLCNRASKALESMAPPPLGDDFKNLVSTAVDDKLRQVIDANIPQLLGNTVQQFSMIEGSLQVEIDKKLHSSQAILKQIADDLFVVAETISTRIRQINFDSLYDVVAHASDPKDSIAVKIMHYSRIFSLVITSVFMLIAFSFLLGLFYGICGRRPTFYNDDCCVRSTGGRFYSCGIWLTIFTFTILSVLTAALFFVSGNSSDLVCRTLRDPLSRPDIVSLGQRYLDMLRTKQQSDDDLLSMLREHSLMDLIRACQRNETLYEIFQLDKKYQLKRLKLSEKEAYDKLERFLNVTLSDLPSIGPINNIISNENFELLKKLTDLNVFNVSSGINQFALSQINSSISSLDVLDKSTAFENRIDSRGGRPKAVTSMLEQMQEIDMRIARPLRLRLQALYKNITRINKSFEEIQVPVESLLSKLQHAQALLADDLHGSIAKAARQQLDEIFTNINQYIDHVKFEMQHDVSSCAPIRSIISSSTAAVCDHTIDPMSGAWMSMLISLLCLVPMIVFATSLVNLYDKMHSYPK
ncbi:unnamed protein product [Nippostrongylus brasiliensis]|uniref:Prominin-like protein n=1 Tax=Nippostrongylus brasiliensis TaxID=27835 RepID=A0A0N4XYD3_NIPBR|nr:unnamed protein product [Nippostrongylus brasiliensis]